MKLSEMTLSHYIDVLASDSGAPGGGSAAALTGAQGAALTNMVCTLTVTKKKYEAHWAVNEKVMHRTAELYKLLLDVMNRDTEAFHEVSAVFDMPRDTQEQKDARAAAMQKGLKNCTLTPTEIMEYAAEAIDLTHQVVGKSNQSAASDLGCAALNLKACILGAWSNVLINLSGIKDEAFTAKYRAHGEELLKKALPLADEVYETIHQSL